MAGGIGASALSGGDHLHRPLSSGAGGAHQRVPTVHGSVFQDLTVSPAGYDLAPRSLSETDRDQWITLHVHRPAQGGGGRALDAHLLQVDGGPALVRSPIIDRTVDQIEDLAAEHVCVALIG